MPIQFDEKLPLIDDFEALFLNDTPLIDVRAPVEYKEGSFPNAINLPLMDDEDRHTIGIEYAEQGQDSAVELGIQRVSGSIKQQRISAWRQRAESEPEGALFCFRGGMRSKISQQWIQDESGISYPRVDGGYKALRRYLIDQLEENSKLMRPVVVGGRTGVGKTELLKKLNPVLDLEGLAHHRGSAFGRHAEEQPSQINFENRLSIAVMKLVKREGNPYFLAEDESRAVGQRHMPHEFFTPFSSAPIIVLEVSNEERVEITHKEYIFEALREYVDLYGEEEGFNTWANYLLDSLERIQRRLGGERYVEARKIMQAAINTHEKNGDTSKHKDWIKLLLIDYYDSMYEYQLSKKAKRIVARGNYKEVCDYLASKYQINAKD